MNKRDEQCWNEVVRSELTAADVVAAAAVVVVDAEHVGVVVDAEGNNRPREDTLRWKACTDLAVRE